MTNWEDSGRDLVDEKLLNCNSKLYIVATGAGALLQQIVWQIPGISSVLVGAEFPYAMEMTDEFLGFTPEKYCSEDTAIHLAMKAYYKAYKYGNTNTVGLGLTASVTSATPHRGEHRVFVCTVTDNSVMLYSVTLPKRLVPGLDMPVTLRRSQDGSDCDQLGHVALLEAVGIDVPYGMLIDAPAFTKTDVSSRAVKLFLQKPFFQPDGTRLDKPVSGKGLVLFPGAFNPPHPGHFWLGDTHKAVFHITVNPPHKPALKVSEMLQRAKLFKGHRVLFTQNDPLYIDKAKSFPGAKFVIGVDAMERMLDPVWGVEIPTLLAEFRACRTRFLVADRMTDGKLKTMFEIANLPLDLTEQITPPEDKLGMSSTAIRNAKNKP